MRRDVKVRDLSIGFVLVVQDCCSDFLSKGYFITLVTFAPIKFSGKYRRILSRYIKLTSSW